MSLYRDVVLFAGIATGTVLACSPSAKQDAKTVVDIVKVLCPNLSCADAILADPNVDPNVKAELRASLHR